MSFLLTFSKSQPEFVDEAGLLGEDRWNSLRQNYGVESIVPFIEPETLAALNTLTQRARRLDPAYVPPDYGRFRVLRHAQPAALALHVRPLSLIKAFFPPALESVEFDEFIGPPPSPPLDPGFPGQTYLRNPDDHPHGIGAVSAWEKPGGDGAGVAAVVFDQCDPTDLDLPPLTPFLLGVPGRDETHSREVMGIIAARRDNPEGGCVGIAYKASYRFASPWRTRQQTPRLRSTVNDIIRVAAAMTAGDVLLLELQIGEPKLPLEIDGRFREAIRHITASGITVVQTAGNGNQDLTNRIPASPDSGSILVAASSLANTRMGSSNHGPRVNCFALGESVATLPFFGSHTNSSGTSAAAAIVAGAAISLQGIFKHKHPGAVLVPQVLREKMVSTGTPAAFGDAVRIGSKPHLPAAILALP